MDNLRNRVAELCLDLEDQYQATKVWNWIDTQSDSSALFCIMLNQAAWAFADNNDANSIRFVYDRKDVDNTLSFSRSEELAKIFLLETKRNA